MITCADISPFRIQIPQTDLDDLHDRLARTAMAFGELMTRLGYERFGAEGGDLGVGVTGRVAMLLPTG
ncbi:hypothetical protein M1P56_16390 [Streptomyces sp. HU2014]|uniref:hypothetical protein n=1 Tax=Streptomyces sp. HU2014 TaxID=2939414 RepID=UPI00200D7AF1|nr:hypothetical protein [Streptomyces sp. HU2014]UQI45822.1 hypothetical protein M1P56_16390 [Streptomyces sp. HU2014]